MASREEAFFDPLAKELLNPIRSVISKFFLMESINELRDKAERLRMISNVLLTIIGTASVILAYVLVSAV